MKGSIKFRSFHFVRFVTCTQFFISFIIFALFLNLTFGRFPILFSTSNHSKVSYAKFYLKYKTVFGYRKNRKENIDETTNEEETINESEQ